PAVPFTMALSPDRKCLLTWDGQWAVRLWEVAGARPLAGPLPLAGPPTAYAFSPDGRTVAVADDKQARLWTVATGQPVGEVMGHAAGVGALPGSPEGRVLVSGDAGGAARPGAAARGDRAGVAGPAGGLVYALAFGPDGRSVATVVARPGAKFGDEAGAQLRSP